MSRKVGLITTGGTIGSILSGGALSVGLDAQKVGQEISRLWSGHDLDINVVAAFNKNSEDVTPGDWAAIIEKVSGFLNDGVRRIVITHGTDTLAYTAAAVGLVFGGSDVRICLTGSFLPLERTGSDAPLNLLAALTAVLSEETLPGVYVAFRTDDRNTEAAIVPALEVKPMSFDSLGFEGAFGRRTALFNPQSGYRVEPSGKDAVTLGVSGFTGGVTALETAAQRVLLLQSYPGLSFSVCEWSKVELLVLGLYHSGTAPSLPAEGSLVAFLEQTQGKVPVLCATFPANLIDVPYASTKRLAGAGAHIFRDLQAHVVYVFAVLGLAAGVTADDIVARLEGWRFSLVER